MLDCIAKLITPGPPDQDCRVYDMQGKLLRVIEAPKPAPELGQIDCLGRPYPESIKESVKQKTRRFYKYDWPTIIPRVIEMLEAGETKWKPIAMALGVEYRAFTQQMRIGLYGTAVREWMRKNGREQKNYRKPLKALADKKEGGAHAVVYNTR